MGLAWPGRAATVQLPDPLSAGLYPRARPTQSWPRLAGAKGPGAGRRCAAARLPPPPGSSFPPNLTAAPLHRTGCRDLVSAAVTAALRLELAAALFEPHRHLSTYLAHKDMTDRRTNQMNEQNRLGDDAARLRDVESRLQSRVFDAHPE